ncbi:MAG: ABC transporter ATP-binding protein [Burkholderiales bacterium]
MIVLDGLSKVFGSRDGGNVAALEDVSIGIRRNEFVTLVGPSGCGKSTLLRLIGGLLLPDKGSVKIDGHAVTEPRADTGIVFQAPTLLPWASVLDNVLFPLVLMKRMAPGSAAHARDLLRLAGLAGFESRFPRELSGGMQQRAAICRALIHDPETLLMDEPFGALDALTREEMTMELLRIWSERRKTIVFVTHSIPEAVLLADRVVVLSRRPGRVAAVIDVPLARPRSFVQEGSGDFQECVSRIRELIFGRRLARAA